MTLSLIQSVFEAHGVEFTEADGVRRKTQNLKILEGEEGFWEFYNDVYQTLLEGADEIFVNNVNEEEFDRVIEDKCSGSIPIFEREGGRQLKKWIDEGVISSISICELSK